MPALQFPDSSASPWDAPNGVTYVWVTSGSSGYWTSEFVTSNLETTYLMLDASNDPITGNLSIGSANEVLLETNGAGFFLGNVGIGIAKESPNISLVADGSADFAAASLRVVV